MMRDAVIAEGIVDSATLHTPERVSREDLGRVHTERYIDAVLTGKLTAAEQRLIGLPWSEGLAERSLRATGATCEAALDSLDAGIAMSLSGGTHHAFADHGEGFCVFNDVVVAIRMLQAGGRIRRAAIIDLDVHQGNGTHALVAEETTVYAFSMHGRKNYPFKKVAGTLDIELEDGVEDTAYLDVLSKALPRVLSGSNPDIVFYLAGSDPHERDRLGKMKLTFEGLARRDVLVIESCRAIGLPVVVTVAGGYGNDIRDSVQAHVNTARICRDFA